MRGEVAVTTTGRALPIRAETRAPRVQGRSGRAADLRLPGTVVKTLRDIKREIASGVDASRVCMSAESRAEKSRRKITSENYAERSPLPKRETYH